MATELKKRKELTGISRQLSNRSPWQINASGGRPSDAHKTRDDRDIRTNRGLSRRNQGRTDRSNTDTDNHSHNRERQLRSPLKRPR